MPAQPLYHPGLAGKMPMKGRRASATKTVHTAVPQVDAETAEIEDFAPPEWRTVLNNRADLGYPDFYPSRPGFNQTEDVLSEEFVKNGFSARTFVAVGAESFSMHGPIFGHLMNGCLGMLNRLGQEVAQKRDEAMPKFGERIYKMPIRVTYNDVKKTQFFADLVNPAVPLHRLMLNSVPHGFKGTELFESMFLPQFSSPHSRPPANSPPPAPIPVDRAVWFIRVIGANEIAAHRARAHTIAAPVAAPSPIPATPSSTNTAPATTALSLSSNDWYTSDFTTMLGTWLRIQINQLALPTKGQLRAGLPKAPTGVLGDEKAKARWLVKWDYSMKLVAELRAKHLLSTRVFMAWLVDTLANANLAQVGFVAQIIGDHLPDLSQIAILSRPFIRAACMKLSEIHSSPAAKALNKVEDMLRQIIIALVDSEPLVLLNPSAWLHHRNTLEGIFTLSEDGTPPNRPTGSLLKIAVSAETCNEMRRRSEKLAFKPAATDSVRSPRRQQMEDLHKLDLINADTDMRELCSSYFVGSAAPTSPVIDQSLLEDKIFSLLNWAMGLFQLGVHRAYAVDTLLRQWSDLHDKAQARRTFPSSIDLFMILYKWLDTSEAARNGENAFAIGITFGDLTRQGLFNYIRYIKVLISQGHSARGRASGEPPSHHLPLLAAMPVFVQAKDLVLQRKIALCGDDEDARTKLENEEEKLMNDFREEVREYIPEVFGMGEYGRSAELREVVYHNMPSAPALNRYLFLQARFWIWSAASECLSGSGSRPPMTASSFVRVIHIYHLCNAYSSICDFLIKALTTSEDEEILDVVIDCIRRNADVWTANDKWEFLTNALMDRNHAQDKRGRHHKSLSELLLELAQRNRLSDEDEEEVRASINKFHKKPEKSDTVWSDVFPKIGPLHQAVAQGNITAAKVLPPKVFSRNNGFSNWSLQWWISLVQSISASKPTHASTVIEAALAHIEPVDDITDDKLDSPVGVWLEGLSAVETLDLMSSKAGPAVFEIILHLVAQRRLRLVPEMLQKLAFSSWKQVANSVITSKGRISSKYAQAISCSLMFALHLLLTTPPDPELPPFNLRQSLIMQTERTRALNMTNAPVLIRHLPFLVVIDTARGTTEAIRDQISTLLRGLAKTPPFKAAAFRHLPVLKDVFLSNEWSKPGLDTAIEAGMFNALKLIMSQHSSRSSAKLETIANLDASARFSAWRWTSVVLSMRVEFKRLALQIENGDDPAQARLTLKELVHATLGRESTADDTDLLCETFRGIEAVAAQEIIAVGMERLTSLLSQMISAESQTSLETLGKNTDLMLRVLSSASASPTTGTSEHSVLAARHGLLDLVSLALQAIERQMTSDDGEPLVAEAAPPRPEYMLGILLDLLKFTLGLEITDTPSPASPRPDFGRLAGAYLRVLLAAHDQCNEKSFTTLQDILVVIIDSAPSVSRNAVHMALVSEMTTPAYAAAIAHRPSLSSVLPHVSPPRRPVSLVNTSMSDAEAGLPLDDRPWEYFEAFEAGKKKTKHGEMFLASKPIRDTSSIPIGLFGPALKRDAVPNMTDDPEADDTDPTTWDDYVSERNLGDGLAGEPISVRQDATALYTNPEDGVAGDDDATTVRSAVSPNVPAGSVIPASPAVSTASTRSIQPKPRRASSRQAGSSKPPAAQADMTSAQTKGSTFDPITFEDSSPDASSGEDSEVEVLEPAGKRPRRGGKTVSSKSTRKTTGGKGVARKGVGGGKTVPRGGKAPSRGGPYRR